MTQHDYVIANQGAVDFRNDINNAFSAIVSQNSGATEPTITFAYMLWYDTASDILKMRNADNDAWISLSNFDQGTDSAEVPVDNLPSIPESKLPVSSTSQKGIIETSTDTEAKAVSDTERAVTPSNIAAIFAEPPSLGSTSRSSVNCTTLDADSTITLSAATRTISINGVVYSYDQAVTNNNWYNLTGGAHRGAFLLIAALTGNDGPAAVFYGADDSNYYGGSVTRALSHAGSAGVYSGTTIEMDWPGSNAPRIRWSGTGASPTIRIWYVRV